MKRNAKLTLCITAIIIINILFCLTADAVMISQKDFIQEIKEKGLVFDEVVITECMTEESEKFLWDTLMRYRNGRNVMLLKNVIAVLGIQKKLIRALKMGLQKKYF